MNTPALLFFYLLCEAALGIAAGLILAALRIEPPHFTRPPITRTGSSRVMRTSTSTPNVSLSQAWPLPPGY